MKIKMTTSAVTNNMLVFSCGETFTVGEGISKEFALAYVKANFATIVEEDIPVKITKKTSKKKEV